MSRNNDYTTGILLDYFYRQNCYKHIGTNLSRQTNTSILRHINFTENLNILVRQCFLLLKTIKKPSLDFLKILDFLFFLFINSNRII